MRKRDIVTKAKDICEYYSMTSADLPLILYGKNASSFYRNHLKSRGDNFFTREIKLSKVNGIFLYESIDYGYIKDNFADYIEENEFQKDCFKNGVVCLMKPRLSTLTHELRHCYQLNNSYMQRYMMIEENHFLGELYKNTYVYYPSEQDAFYETLNYLNESGRKLESFFYARKIRKLEKKYYKKSKKYYSLSF